MKKFFITGGTGFIGSNLISELLKNPKNKIRVVIRKKSNLSRIKKFLNKIELIQIDFNNRKDISNALKDIDTVFHLASVLGRGRKNDYINFNIKTSETIFKLAAAHNIKKVVYLSSMAVMGGTYDTIIYNEEMEPAPKNQYGKSKLAVEKIAMDIYKNKKLNITIFRPPSVYGENDNFDRGFIRVIDLIIRKKFIPVGNMNNMQSLIYIKNLINAMLLVANEYKKSNGKIYFVSDNEILTARETYYLIAKLGGVQPVKFHLPIKPLLYMEKFIEKTAKVLGFLPPFPENIIHDLTANYACSIRKIKQDLNWEPPFSVYEGLENTINWYKQVKNER